MKERLNLMIERYNYLNDEMLKPEIYNEYNKMKVISKEKNSLEETVKTYKKLLSVEDDIEAAKEMMKDQEMREFAEEELENLHNEKTELESKLRVLLLPKDPNDEKNVIMEIRGAAGGDEGNIFAGRESNDGRIYGSKIWNKNFYTFFYSRQAFGFLWDQRG